MSEKINSDDLVGIFHTTGPSMCSVCLVREQRDGDEFVPCSPECYQAALWACEQQVIARMGDECTRREQHGFYDGFGHGAAAMKEAARNVVAGALSAPHHFVASYHAALDAIDTATVEPQ